MLNTLLRYYKYYLPWSLSNGGTCVYSVSSSHPPHKLRHPCNQCYGAVLLQSTGRWAIRSQTYALLTVRLKVAWYREKPVVEQQWACRRFCHGSSSLRDTSYTRPQPSLAIQNLRWHGTGWQSFSHFLLTHSSLVTSISSRTEGHNALKGRTVHRTCSQPDNPTCGLIFSSVSVHSPQIQDPGSDNNALQYVSDHSGPLDRASGTVPWLESITPAFAKWALRPVDVIHDSHSGEIVQLSES